jgi:PAS domain S-box-containing protein
MNYLGKSKSELISVLQKLQQDYDSLNTLYLNHSIKCSQTEEALRKSVGKWYNLVTNIPDYIALHDPEGRYLFLNHYAEGFSEKNVIGRSLYDFIAEDSKKIFRRNFDLCLNTRQSQHFEYSAFGHNKFLRNYENILVPIIDNEQIVSIMSIAMDITDRRHADKLLEESRNELQAIFDSSPSMICILDKERRVIQANKVFKDSTGWPDSQITLSDRACGILGCIFSLDDPRGCGYGPKCETCLLRLALVDTLEYGNQHLGIEYRTTLFVGEVERNVVLIGSTARIETCRGNEILLTLIDVTSGKQAEAALIESETRFRSLFDNSQIGISASSPDGKILKVNHAFARMYGYENPDMILSEVEDAGTFYANQTDRKNLVRSLRRNGFIDEMEIEVVRRNGSHFFVMVSASEVRDPAGNLLYNHVTHVDLTDRIKAEEQLRETSLYSRNLIEANLDPLLVISIEGKITDVNFATEKITGIRRKKLIGTDFTDYFAEPEKASIGCNIALSKGMVRDYPLVLLQKSGRTFDVLFNASLYKNKDGEAQCVFASAHNISNRKIIEEDLRRSKELLEKLYLHLNEIREEERSLISREIHDQLGQIMTALKLDLNHMQRYVGANSEAIMKLNSMIELVSNAIKVVQRISSDLRPGILDDLGLVSAIEWYCDEFEKRTEIKCHQKLENSDYRNSQINLILFRVLQESLTNVIRHAMATSVTVRLQESLKSTTLTIHDNGIGISEEMIKSHNSLGLISMRERVRQFNGKINISSKKLNGTKLTVMIPY